MEQYFTFGIILLIVFGSTWQFVRLKRQSARNIISDYSLQLSDFSLKWTGFILPALILFAGHDAKTKISISNIDITCKLT